MPKLKEAKANKNEKMIEVKLRFWTNNIAKNKGYIVPKHALPRGVVRIESNKTHGIKSTKKANFNSLLQIGVAVERVLIAHGIVLHLDRNMQKYLTLRRESH